MDKRDADTIAAAIKTEAGLKGYAFDVDTVYLGKNKAWFVHLDGEAWIACIFFAIETDEAGLMFPVFHCTLDNKAQPLAADEMPVLRTSGLQVVLEQIAPWFPAEPRVVH